MVDKRETEGVWFPVPHRMMMMTVSVLWSRKPQRQNGLASN